MPFFADLGSPCSDAAEIKESCREHSQQNQELQRQLVDSQTSNKRLKHQIEGLQRQLTEAHASNKQLEEETKALQRQPTDAPASNEHLEQQNQELQHKLTEAQTSIKHLDTISDLAQALANERLAMIEALQAEIKRLSLLSESPKEDCESGPTWDAFVDELKEAHVAQEEINVTSEKISEAEEGPYCLADDPLFPFFANKHTDSDSESEYEPNAKPPSKSKSKKATKVKNAKVDTTQECGSEPDAPTVRHIAGRPDAVVSGITSFPPSSPELRNVTRSDYLPKGTEQWVTFRLANQLERGSDEGANLPQWAILEPKRFLWSNVPVIVPQQTDGGRFYRRLNKGQWTKYSRTAQTLCERWQAHKGAPRKA